LIAFHQTAQQFALADQIILAVKASMVMKPGVECRIKQVLIRREFFDLDRSHSFGLARLTGEVNADFLPVTSARNDFLRDSAEFKIFYWSFRTRHSALRGMLWLKRFYGPNFVTCLELSTLLYALEWDQR